MEKKKTELEDCIEKLYKSKVFPNHTQHLIKDQEIDIDFIAENVCEQLKRENKKKL
ncbi:MAG: hypothetical protein ACOC44_14030 [Promethearchaeia archaeon]